MIDPHDLTQRGIEAIQSGDRTHARMLLLEAIELDDSIEMAWLWLAETIDDPDDQIVALENVLTLNPDNAEAHKRLEELRSPHKIVALGLLPIDILMLVAGYRQGYISVYVLPVQLLMDGIMLFFVMLSNSLYAGYAVRELTKMQHSSRSAGELYNLGHKFSRERKWALATLYWQKATVLDSYKAAYFQQLGIGYAQINRYPRALQALKDAQRLEPENAKIKQALALVERRVKQQRSNKKKTGKKKKRI